MWIFNSWLVLFWVTSICLALAAWKMNGYLSEEGHGQAAILMVFLFIYHSTLTYHGVRDFHPLALLPLPFIGAFIAYQKQRFGVFLAWCVAVVSLRENLFLVPLSWAVISVLQRRSQRWIVGPACLALGHFLIAYLIAPQFFDAGISPGLTDYYQGYGTSIPQMLGNVFHQPGLPFSYLFQKNKLDYCLGILGPFLVVTPFFRWWWLPALPTLVLILFSTQGRLVFPELHYSIEVVMWLVVSTVFLFKDQKAFFEKPWVGKTVMVLLFFVLADYTWKTLRYTGHLVENIGSARYEQFLEIKDYIPQEGSLVAPRRLALHLASRAQLHFLYEVEVNQNWDDVDLAIVEDGDKNRVPSFWLEVKKSGPFSLMKPP